MRASDSPVIHAQAEFAEHFTQDLIQHIHAVTPEYFEQIVADIFTALGFNTEEPAVPTIRVLTLLPAILMAWISRRSIFR